MGLIDAADVVSWADEIISERQIPPIEIIDLSLTKPSDRQGILAQLGRMSGREGLDLSAHRALLLLRTAYMRSEIDLEFVCRALHAYCNWANVSEEEKNAMWGLHYVVEDAISGHYGTPESARDEVMDYLGRVLGTRGAT